MIRIFGDLRISWSVEAVAVVNSDEDDDGKEGRGPGFERFGAVKLNGIRGNPLVIDDELTLPVGVTLDVLVGEFDDEEKCAGESLAVSNGLSGLLKRPAIA
jgi:hypothetical protein